MQRLRQHQAQVYFSRQLHGVAQHRSQHITHPVQTINNALIVRAHTQDLRHLLAHIGICAVAVGFVLNDVHKHRR
ncbi:hypothetical protein SDC9_181912 [bioreactor metagenome]|uniref:Uncharacterized protein n=1 Tax=bioreactor metagenome TaxID=1076179 RepID=A0A645H8K1_9ZZZZ